MHLCNNVPTTGEVILITIDYFYIFSLVNSGGSKQTCRWYTFKTTEPIREERVNKVCYKTQEEYLNVPLRRRQDIYSQMKYVCVSGPPQKCKRARRPTLLEDKVTFLDLLRYRNKYYQKKTKKGILRVRKGICGRASRFYKLKYGYICQKKPMKY